ncbi:Anaphase-promoting complex subunit 2 [Saguinus oedipus]|uniref:Anaphase-promoting complex subunit 2 n=1 Tax=Saguinus oedipus TaxID=9490 RepID=A0ABQ9WKI2_SAGOE|nr:Anaphase-promoting complex subunit 2 [Saguinus oedipus]
MRGIHTVDHSSAHTGRTREDTVRQIVAGLTGDSDGTGDLAVELSKTDPASLETGQDSEDDSGEPEDWVPDPVDADPASISPMDGGFGQAGRSGSSLAT